MNKKVGVDLFEIKMPPYHLDGDAITVIGCIMCSKKIPSIHCPKTNVDIHNIPVYKSLNFYHTDLLKIMINPASFYDNPNAVLLDMNLSHQQKKDVLQNWEFDARELDSADDENMVGGLPSLLSDVLNAINKLKADNDLKKN